MKAQELRIGNYYLQDCLGGEISQIKAKDILELYDDPLEDYYKPILLTEEWLLKFGFEKKGINRPKWTFWKIDLVEDKKGIYSFDESRIYIDIQYVHQLQNLYFALTGEELTIKQHETEKV